MQDRESSGSNKSTVLAVSGLASVLAVAALMLWPQAEPQLAAISPVVAPQPERGASATPVTATRVTATRVTSAEPSRVDVTPTTIEPVPTEVGPLVFEECVERLCEMGARIAELAQEDEHAAARDLDAKVRQLVEELLAAFADAGERSVQMLVTMAGEPDQQVTTPLRNTRLGVLQVLLQGDLGRRHKLAEQVGDHARVDALVQAVLDAMPIGTLAAQMGNRCLHQAPYLRGGHEPTVLHLLQLAGNNEFPRAIATNLLLTLWDNMLASGERSSAELSRLALLRLDSSDPSAIVAACRQLLSEDKYRSVVLAWLRERSDHALAGNIAELAAKELPVRDALEVLRELSPLLGHRRGTYLTLGIRAPEIVADAYREHLAANNQPDIRRELIMGVSMLPDQQGLELAELALHNDPSPEVRIQAMYAFTIHADAAKAEQVVSQLLDEPAIATNELHLGAIVLAMQNLEHGDPNTVARLGARLKTMPLTEQSRRSLTALLSRCLPAGESHSGNGSRPGGG